MSPSASATTIVRRFANNPVITLLSWSTWAQLHSVIGDVAAAKVQLTEIEKRCGKGREEYALLAADRRLHEGLEA